MRERVLAARERQLVRGTPTNAACPTEEIELDEDGARLLEEAGIATGLSGRGRDRVVRVARTLADLAERDSVTRRGHRRGAGDAPPSRRARRALA